MSLEKSTPYRNAWYRDLLEKEAELKQYTDEKVAQAIELPEVTSEDNGDLLAADDGSWVKSDKLKTIMNAGIDEVGKIPMVGATGEWGLTDYPSNELPSVTSADNGKVAGVVDGNWDTMDIPNELPAVTGADDGKVLGVTSGAWGAVEPQKSGLVVFTINNSNVLQDNKTVNDILLAIENGSDVVIKKSTLLYRMVASDSSNLIYFICFAPANTNNNLAVYVVYATKSNPASTSLTALALYRCVPNTTSTTPKILTGSSTGFEYIDPELPAVSASDNGSVLMVVNGQWAVGQVASSPIPISSSNSINAITVEGSLL